MAEKTKGAKRQKKMRGLEKTKKNENRKTEEKTHKSRAGTKNQGCEDLKTQIFSNGNPPSSRYI